MGRRAAAVVHRRPGERGAGRPRPAGHRGAARRRRPHHVGIDGAGWPACGEIGVMEVVGSRPATVHGPGFAGLGGGIGASHDAGADLSAGFHDYAVDWSPERITWSLDGVPYGTLTPAHVPAWVFDHDFYLLLNLAIGGDWPGNRTDSPRLPATMLVDWVRVG